MPIAVVPVAVDWTVRSVIVMSELPVSCRTPLTLELLTIVAPRPAPLMVTPAPTVTRLVNDKVPGGM